MPTIQQLTEQRNNVWSQMTEVIEAAEREGRDLSAEERSKYDAAEADLDRLSGDVDRQKRHDERARQLATVERDSIVAPPAERAAVTDDEYRNVFNSYLRFGMGDLEPEQRQILRRGFAPDTENRAQAVGTNSAGGYLVPAGYRNRIVETMKDYGQVMEVAEVITTESGNPLPWPTNNDTSNVGALLAENTQITEQDLTLGTAQLDAYKYTSKLTRVSLELIQDSAFDIEDFIVRKHGERLGRITNQHLTTGTGTAQPNGIVTGAVNGKTAAAAAAITADELIDLIHSVDPAYRNA
ncbi:MAG: phage major capsid protein, partial [Actinomycetota bacterium]|nr:phage major capsid protein [Actinomycetota bacterium]